MDPVLIPSLVQLRDEIDDLAPFRPRGSDGWIGDKAHQGRVSDHNDDEVGLVPIRDADRLHEVHGLDVTRFAQLDAIVSFVLARCRAGLENRLRYIIWDHVIYEASNGWRARTYEGDDPHTEHAHFSGSYDTLREADTRSWKLGDIMALDVDDLDNRLELKPFKEGGGNGSTIGNAVLGHGYARRPGEQRRTAWSNLQALQVSLDELHAKADEILELLRRPPV